MTLQEQSWTKQCRYLSCYRYSWHGDFGGGGEWNKGSPKHTIYMTKSSSQNSLDMSNLELHYYYFSTYEKFLIYPVSIMIGLVCLKR